MPYEEFTCDNLPPLAELRARSMVKLADGSTAQQVVIVTVDPGDGGGFDADGFSNGFNI